jgi:hypothetical protein
LQRFFICADHCFQTEIKEMNLIAGIKRFNIKAIYSFLLWAIVTGCSSSQTEAQTVYITKSGQKYHSSTCRHIRSSGYPISLSKAQDQGYTPCSVCQPLTTKGDSSSINKLLSTPKANPSQQNNTQATQCTSRTKSGLRCKRTTRSASGRCWQHE